MAKALPGDDEDEQEEEAADKKAKTPAAAASEAPAKKEEAKKPAHSDGDEDESGGTYGVVKEAGQENAEPAVKFEDLRKKFPKSKRGPAMAITVTPSNLMILFGMIGALFDIGWFMRHLWPFIFSNDVPKGNAATNHIIWLVACVISFCIHCLVCYGASKMHTLESIGWAWTGAILSIISCGILGWIAGGMAVAALQRDEVKEGFEETLNAHPS